MMEIQSSEQPIRRASGKWYIYHSKAGTQGPVKEQADSNTDLFLSFLENQCIILKEEPAPSAHLDGTDSWAKWLQRFDKQGRFSVHVRVAETTRIEGFEFDFNFSFIGTSRVVFSSSANSIESAFGKSQCNIPMPGIASDGGLLYCGLDLVKTTKQVKTSVDQVFRYVGQTRIAERLPGQIASMTLTLDTSKAKEKRNAFWFNPAFHSQTTVRLQFAIDAKEGLEKILKSSLSGLAILEADLICKKILIATRTVDGPNAADQGSVAFSIKCQIKAAKESIILLGRVEFYDSSISITFRPDSGDVLKVILAWLGRSVLGQEEELGFVDEILGKDGVFKNFLVREITVGLSRKSNNHPFNASRFHILVEAGATIGSGAGQQHPVFLFAYRWTRGAGKLGAIRGELWNGLDQSGPPITSPFYEWWTNLTPATTHTPAKSIDLCTLIPGQTIENVPDSIPTEITSASVFLSDKTFAIGGNISTHKSSSSVPHPSLGMVRLSASYSWGKSHNFSFLLGIMADITRPGQIDPTILMGELQYNSSRKEWTLEAGLDGLYASSLYYFFDPSSSEYIMPLIRSITIRDLVVNYSYAPVWSGDNRSTGSKFTIGGSLMIAGLELDLDFSYSKDWKFTASLKTQNADATVGDIVSSILGEDQFDLPDFIANTKFSNGNTLDLVVHKQKPGKGEEKETESKDSGDNSSSGSFHFIATVCIGKMKLTFAQYHGGGDWNAEKKKCSKRLIKVALQGLDIPPIDLIGKMEQPFDEMLYTWVQDPVTEKGVRGLTRQEVEDLNVSLAKDPLIFKDKFKKPSKTDVLITSGSHFSILMRGSSGSKSCLLVYDFKSRGQTQKALPPSSTEAEQLSQRHTDATDGDSVEDDGTSVQAPLKKKAGPLSLKNIGLKYANKQLHILFDATFELGPIELSLLGFSIPLTISRLDEFPTVSTPSLEGLAVSYAKRPLTIAGIIRHGNTETLNYYAGGLIVGFVPYEFQAAGFYGEAKPEGQKPFISMFVFAKLNGPLFQLGCAEVSGLTGGFGYNSDVKTPAPDQVVNFPFVNQAKLGDNADSPIKTLEAFTSQGDDGWFHPKNEMYWAAAGLRLNAFQMLTVDAVLLVQFGSSVKLGIFALAVADIPSTKSTLEFAHVELGFALVVDFDYGTLKAEGQLSPNSYILHPDCHLTGGFALCYWFDSPHADQALVGDFVFTLGGYHQAFAIPDRYPRPPRLGISWSLNKNLSIRGEAYFAITPKACMGGGMLHASYAAGPIEAWFDAMADFLINYKPFNFTARISISVGVRFSADVLFLHASTTAELSAELTLWGPPVAGKVHVDFWLHSFDINFGESPTTASPVTLIEFYELVLQSGSKGQQAHGTSAAPAAIEQSSSSNRRVHTRDMNESHIFLAQSGLHSSGEQTQSSSDTPWTVRAGSFSFFLGCKMAIQTASHRGDTVHHDEKIYAKPMRLKNPMSSTLTIEIAEDGVEGSSRAWRMEKQVKSVPRGLWDKYDEASDPCSGSGNNYIRQLLDSKNGTLPLMMGVLLTVPPPDIYPLYPPVRSILDDNTVDLQSKKSFPIMPWSNEAFEPVRHIPPANPWNNVHQAWNQPLLGKGDGGQSGFVSRWAEVFNWNKSGSKLESLAGLPKKMDARFNDLFVAAPLMTK